MAYCKLISDLCFKTLHTINGVILRHELHILLTGIL